MEKHYDYFCDKITRVCICVNFTEELFYLKFAELGKQSRYKQCKFYKLLIKFSYHPQILRFLYVNKCIF